VVAVGVTLTVVAVAGLALRALLREETIYPVQVALSPNVPPDRGSTSLRAWISDGVCVPTDELPASRFDHADVDITRFSFVIHAKMRTQEGMTVDTPCAGVGAPAFPVRITLPLPLGDRAVVSSVGPHAPKLVLLLPRRRGELRIFAPPEYFYDSEDCDAARRFFRGAIADWCSKLF
jgi:hypothetical protein